MKELVEIFKTKAFTILVGTVCGVYVITEVKKAIVEVKNANLQSFEK